MEKDLTVGSPRKVLWKFCLPLFGSIVIQQLYNIAYSLVAGKINGENSLAADGNSYEITLVFIAFAFGCNIGCSVVAARFFGAKRIADVKSAVSTAYISSAVLCAVLTVLGLTCAPLLLKAINTPDSIFADSLLYLYIYVGGLFFLFFYNIATGVFAALGDSVTPFILLAVSSVANIFVDILFVTVFAMGVAGVAWATFICQGMSCVVANIVLVFRLKKLRSEEKHRVFSKAMLGEFAKVAEEEGFTELAAKFKGVAAIEKTHEERYLKLLQNVKDGTVFKRPEVQVWRCRNCGHLHIGAEAPEVCPVCAHPKAYFELDKENY